MYVTGKVYDGAPLYLLPLPLPQGERKGVRGKVMATLTVQAQNVQYRSTPGGRVL